ncbi:MAG: hypothetical protein LBP96_05420, partial [Bacteroidales bacterium]|nr:hypothetical protein [Bacteroidales bacterium]
MKKILLPFIFVMIISVWSCGKAPEIEAIPPTGVWEELMYVPVEWNADGTPLRKELKTFEEIGKMGEIGDSLQKNMVYMLSRIDFGDGSGRMNVEIRYGDGPKKPHHDSLHCYLPSPRRDYFTAEYRIEGDKTSLKYIKATNGRFTGEAYGDSQPLPCASNSTYFSTRTYDFS